MTALRYKPVRMLAERSRRRWLPGLAVIAVALTACTRKPTKITPGRTNVVLVVFDTARADRFGVMGATPTRTPEVDRLAADGVAFTSMFADSSWTRSSFASLMTGQHARTVGVYEEEFDRLPADVHTLAESFKAAGYLTLGVNSNPNVNTSFGFDQGYDAYEDSTTRWKWQRDGHKSGNQRARLENAESVTARTLALVDRQTAGKGKAPLFLHVVYIDPHTPLRPPPDLVKQMREAGSRTARYDAEMLFADRHLAALLKGLSERGMMDDTLVVFTTDHGEGLRDHPSVPTGASHGTTLYDSVVRVPLVLSHPALSKRRFDGLSSNVDILPTLLDLFALPAPPTPIAGLSHAPQVLGTSIKALREHVISETEFRVFSKRSVRTREHRYVDNADCRLFQEEGAHKDRRIKPRHKASLERVPTEELYRIGDRPEDPKRDNRINDPVVQARLKGILDAWQESTPRRPPENRVTGSGIVYPDGRVVTDGPATEAISPSEGVVDQLKALGYMD